MDLPLVSVFCITYNQASYIRQCLEGILMQKTTFSFEILIHDDASTDNTANIIYEYELMYPVLINPIYQIDNQYSKGGIDINMTFNLPRAKGKYIAFCEGDDYWIDPLKLQKQVDFLEEHEDFGLVHTESDVLFQENQLMQTCINHINKINNGRFLLNEELSEAILAGVYVVRTPSVMFRKELLLRVINEDKFLFENNFLMGDTQLWVELSKITKFFYLDESTTVYRKNFGSASRQTNLKKKLRFSLSSAELRMYFCLKYDFSSSFERKVRKFYKRNLFFYKIFDPRYQPMFSKVKQEWLFSLIVRNPLLRILGRGMVRMLICFNKT